MIRRKPLELRVCHTWMQGRVCVGRKDWAEKVLWDLDNGIRSFFGEFTYSITKHYMY